MPDQRTSHITLQTPVRHSPACRQTADVYMCRRGVHRSPETDQPGALAEVGFKDQR